jgi:alpha-tubulin suppressor-like RCC1 family protein
MTTTRKSLQLFAMILAFLAAAAAVETRMPSNTIAVDKASYEAGDEVFISGGGWTPGELVTIEISEDGNPGHIDTLYVTADLAGAVTIEHILAGHGSPQNFTVTATSPSMQPTTTTFADAGNRPPLSWNTGSWATATPATNPWVRTDRDDYHPGEVAEIAGGGWTPGDLVTLDFTEVGPSVFHPTVRLHAIADASGSIAAGYVLQRHDAGESYSLTATSSASQGMTAHTTFTDSAYAYGSTCAVLSNGGLQCWGWNGVGQLGDGTTTQRLTPVTVSGLSSGVAQVSTGYQHTCAVLTSGALKCWGYNQDGQLGTGTNLQSLTPVTVNGLGTGVAQVSAGIWHTCALMTSGSVWCWGYNGYGQLGDGTFTNRFSPVSVNGLTSGVVQITAGAYHTCALLASGGVQCWGNNYEAELGDGTTTLRPTPVNVVGLTGGVAQVSAGTFHTCAVLTSSGVKCWGWNPYGQLGDGTTSAAFTPVSVVGLTSGVAQMRQGYLHSCALMTSGGVKCWGNNGSGQLGDGTGTQRLTPVDVSGLVSGAVQIMATAHHTCALLTTGGMQCWGANFYGQLGDGTTTTRFAPFGVSGLTSGVAAVPDNTGTMYSLTYVAGPNGSITGAASQIVPKGSSGSTVTAVPNPGYRFLTWGDGVLTAARTDTNVNGNLGVLATFVIDTVATTVTLATTANPITYGSPLTLTASVAPVTPGTMTGTVTFKDGATAIGSAAVNAAGIATLTVSPSVGAHSYTADYGGDGHFLPSSSGTVSQTVDQAVLTVTANSTSRPYGTANPAFTASFSGFVAGETLVTSGVTGSASLTTTAVTTSPPGSYAITAAAGTLAAANYTFSFVDGTLTIVKASQAITFNALANKTYGDPPFAVTATSSSGLPVSLSVFSGPATISGNTVTLTGSGTVTIRASQPGDANFNAAVNVDRSFTVAVPDLNVTSITMETRRWSSPIPASSAQAIAIYNSLPLGVSGYAPGPKTLTLFDNVSNQITFGGTAQNIGYHHHFAFNAPVAGTLSVRLGADFGGGGTLIIDGTVIQFRNTQMWWAGSYSDPTQYLSGTVSIGAGPHTIDSYGFEDCCDGPQQAQYSYLGAAYKTFAAPANTVPVVGLSGPFSVTVGVSTPYTFSVTDPDAGASFTVGTVSCGVNGTIDGSVTTTSSGGSFNCIFPNAATTSTVSVDVTDNFGAVSNTATRNVTSSKLTQTITFPAPADTTYGAADFPVTASASSGLTVTIAASGPCVLSSGTVHVTGAGTCVLTASQGGDATYFAATNVVRSVAIAKASLTVRADDKSRLYGAANPPLTATITGFVNGEVLATSGVTGTPALSTVATGTTPVGMYPITAAAGTLAAANYAFAYAPGVLTISGLQLTVTAKSANRPYGAANPDVSAPLSITGFVAGETATVIGTQPTCSTTATPSSPVGSYPVTCSGGAATNYTFAYTSGTLTVDPVQLTVTARSANRPYGATNPDVSTPLSIAGFVAGEGVGVLSAQPTCTTTATAASPAGPYPVTCTGGAAANYTFAYTAGVLTVDAVQLMVTARSANRPYGAANPDVSTPLSITGFVGSEGTGVFSVQPTCTTTATAASPLGAYPVTCSGRAADHSS